MTEKQWLENQTTELRKNIGLVMEEYDEGRLTKADAMARVGLLTKDSLSTTYDRAFTKGIEAADLDPDSTEELGDIEIDDEGDEHPL